MLSLLAATAAVPLTLTSLGEASAMGFGFGHMGMMGGGMGRFQTHSVGPARTIAPRTTFGGTNRSMGDGGRSNRAFTGGGKDRIGDRVVTSNGKGGYSKLGDSGSHGKLGDTGKGNYGKGDTGKGSHGGGDKVATGERHPGGDDHHRPGRWHRPIWPVVTGGGVVSVLTPEAASAPTTVTGGGGGGGNQPARPNNVARRPGTGVPPAGEQHYVKDEVVIEVATFMTNDAATTLARRHRLVPLQSAALPLAGTTLMRLRIADRRSVSATVRELERDVAVLSAQPNYLYTLVQDSKPVTAGYDPAQYAVGKLNLPEAHGLAKGEKVVVAVIDSGVDVTHPDLAGDIADSYDALGKGDKIHTHGTAVAGAIAAHGHIMGAAPSARLLTIRAFSGVGTDDGTTFAIATGVNWAAEHGARVINMSFAGAQDREVALNLTAAYDRGIVLVAAAGNKGPKSAPLFPASDPHVIAVTATDEDDKLFPMANRGKHIAVSAPGVDLMLIAPHNDVQYSTGTSFAAPYVAGTVALMLERRPDLTPDAIKKTLMTTARDLGPKGVDDQFGAGLVDPYRALLAVAPATVGIGAAAGAVPAPVVPASVQR